LVALSARGKVGSSAKALDDVRADIRRLGANVEEEVERSLSVQRHLLAGLAAGDPITREMILEGRLWAAVGPAEAQEMLEREKQLRIVDVRTPGETAGGILPGAVLIPVDQLEARVSEIPRDGRRTLVYCAGGGRSAAACELLSSLGYSNLSNLSGGIGSWGGPVVRPGAEGAGR
jgi:rhodanese-related sulfurtransferase